MQKEAKKSEDEEEEEGSLQCLSAIFDFNFSLLSLFSTHHCIIQSAEFEREREMGLNGGGVVVRFGLWVVALSIAGYIVGPPLYWHLIELLNHSSSSSCTPCVCDCSSQPIISIPQGIHFPTNSIPPLLPFSFSAFNISPISSFFQNNCFHQFMCFQFRSTSFFFSFFLYLIVIEQNAF